MRLHFALLLAHALTHLSALAPVPKPKPVEPLTADAVVGTWGYLWGSHADGIITFEKDGSYSAQHDPGGAYCYAGTWKVDGNVVTLTEFGFRFDTGVKFSGPAEYAFDFGATRPPVLVGVSNGSVPVALKNRTR